MNAKLIKTVGIVFALVIFSTTAVFSQTPEKILTQAEVESVIEVAARGALDAIGDESLFDEITEKWEEHEDLEGKTRSQILRLLFADVQAVIKDPAMRTKIWRAWYPPAPAATVPKPAATPGPKPAAVPTTQTNTVVTVPKAGTVSVSKFPGGPDISFAFIPAGLFKMGANGIQTGETVKINKAFWMQQTEVTQAQWKAVMGPTDFSCFVSESMMKPLEQKFFGDRKPVVCVTRDDAAEFVRQLNLKNDGYHYRLPTGAEWEYAARADSINDKPGDDLDSIAWYLDNSDGSGTHDVATKKANAWGLYDMLGNAEEWVQECSYTCEIRGGDYAGFGIFMYPAYKRSTGAEYTSNGRGFRVLREAGPASPRPKPAVSTSGPPAGTLSRMLFKAGVEASFAYIPPGEFEMGSLNGEAWERPAHTVRISKGFWMQTTEVTQAQWMTVMGAEANQCDITNDYPERVIPAKYRGDLFPVTCVNWENITGFIRRLNEKNDGFIYRLPTEAEWEYAARAGTVGQYSGDVDSLAWRGGVRKVATKKPNPWGLYDIHGNVSEQVQDLLGDYPAGMVTDPLSTKGRCPVTRGGSLAGGSSQRGCLASSVHGSRNDGFRLVRVPR